MATDLLHNIDNLNKETALLRLQEQLKYRPQQSVRDIYVWLHQANFASQVYTIPHILDFRQRITEEQEMKWNSPLFEPLGYRSKYIRLFVLPVYLYGGPLITLEEIANKTLNKTKSNPMQFTSDWKLFLDFVKEEKVPFSMDDVIQFDKEQAFHEHKQIDHSKKYTQNNSTFYLVILWELFQLKFPEFEEHYNENYFLPKEKIQESII